MSNLEKMVRCTDDQKVFVDYTFAISNERESKILHFDCSPEDGVQILIESDHARGTPGHKVILKEWLYLHDLKNLRHSINQCLEFYQRHGGGK